MNQKTKTRVPYCVREVSHSCDVFLYFSIIWNPSGLMQRLVSPERKWCGRKIASRRENWILWVSQQEITLRSFVTQETTLSEPGIRNSLSSFHPTDQPFIILRYKYKYTHKKTKIRKYRVFWPCLAGKNGRLPLNIFSFSFLWFRILLDLCISEIFCWQGLIWFLSTPVLLFYGH